MRENNLSAPKKNMFGMMARSWYPDTIKHMKWRIIIKNVINKTGQVAPHLLTEEKKRNCSKLPTSMHIFFSWFLLTKAKKNLVFSIKIELVYLSLIHI